MGSFNPGWLRGIRDYATLQFTTEAAMSKHTAHESKPEPPPAPPADVMTPEPPERAAPVKTFTPTTRDAQALFEGLARMARLRGYEDHHIPEHKGDIDMTGLSPEVAGLVDFARKA